MIHVGGFLLFLSCISGSARAVRWPHSTTPTRAISREDPREDVGVVECGLYCSYGQRTNEKIIIDVVIALRLRHRLVFATVQAS